MGEAMVRLHQVNKWFGKLHVLRDVDLTVERGQVVVIMGASGSGKSTLVRCINHLEPIDSGEIWMDGRLVGFEDVDGRRRRLGGKQIAQFRARIGMVFQSFNLFPHMTVMGNIIEAPVGVLGLAPEVARQQAVEILEKVGLTEKADAYPATLSGGQQQRVAIVRALIMNPKLMLFDEPTSALDPELIGEVLDVIRDIAIQGRTCIVVTHEVGFAREVASKIVFMDGGRVIEEGAPEVILGSPREERTRTFLRRIL